MATLNEWKRRALNAERRAEILQKKFGDAGGVDVGALQRKVIRLERALSLDIIAFRKSAESLIGVLCHDLSQAVVGQYLLEGAAKMATYNINPGDRMKAKEWIDDVWHNRHEIEAELVVKHGEDEGYRLAEEQLVESIKDFKNLQELSDDTRASVDKYAGELGEKLFQDILDERERLEKQYKAIEDDIKETSKD